MKKFILIFVLALVATAFTNVAVASYTGEHKASKIEQVNPDGVKVSVADFNYEVDSADVASPFMVTIGSIKVAAKADKTDCKNLPLSLFNEYAYLPVIKGKVKFIKHKHNSIIYSYKEPERAKNIFHSCRKFC
ncbi:MAG: hypothetical protein V4549_07480 [Bacteroidota bacterium]